MSDLADSIKALENDAQYLRDNLPNLDDPPTADQLTLISAFIGVIQNRLDRLRELTALAPNSERGKLVGTSKHGKLYSAPHNPSKTVKKTNPGRSLKTKGT